MIREVLPDELMEKQAQFMGGLDRAATASNGLFTAQAIFDAVMSRKARLFETKDGIAVIDGLLLESGLLVRIAAVAGDNIPQWISQVDEIALTIASQLGARGVTSICSPKWEAEVINRGYSITHIAAFRELPPNLTSDCATGSGLPNKHLH